MHMEKGMRNIALQMTEYVNEAKVQLYEETEERKNQTAQRIYRKAESGQKLTAEEKSFLARNNSILYAKVMRAEAMREALESKLKSCQTEEEAQAAYSAAFNSIAKGDPDRELLLKTINEVWREFCENKRSDSFKEGDETKEKYRFIIGGSGYQELYLEEKSAPDLDFYS